MHELAIAQQLIEIIEENAKKHSLSSVKLARLRIGKMSAFNPENIKFCFNSYEKNELLKDIKLEIEEAPVELECQNCGHKWLDTRFDDLDFAHDIAHNPIQYQPPSCHKCNTQGPKITSGNQMQLVDLEGE